MMIGRWRRFRIDERGQAALEFALVMPLLLILAIGVFEFGRAWNAHQVITDAAREGARRAVIADPTIVQDSVEAAIREAVATAGFDPDSAAISFPDGFKTGRGNVTTVQVQLPYYFVFLRPLLGLASSTGGRILLTTVTRMRNE